MSPNPSVRGRCSTRFVNLPVEFAFGPSDARPGTHSDRRRQSDQPRHPGDASRPPRLRALPRLQTARRRSPRPSPSLPDLVLLDVMMPKMNGFDVCRLLKNDPTLPFMAIILVTAKADTQGCRRRARGGRRRISHQARRSGGAGGARALGAAAQGAARPDRRAGSRSRRMESHSGAAGRRAGRRNRADRARSSVFCRRRSRGSWSPPVTRTCSRATGAPLPSCSATCAGSARFPSSRSPRR